MEVKLVNQMVNLNIVPFALRMCTDTKDKLGNYEEDKEFAKKWAVDKGHESTLEHLSWSFHIIGFSRALLQELSRHRIASLSVKSSRYTLKELLKSKLLPHNTVVIPSGLSKRQFDFYCTVVDEAMRNVVKAMNDYGFTNDQAKYLLPEAFKTECIFTVNTRSLRNLIKLRTSPAALAEFRELANKLYECIPATSRWMLEDVIYKEM